jgi:hypothetical protein
VVSLDALEQAETGDAFNRIKRGETTDAAMRPPVPNDSIGRPARI